LFLKFSKSNQPGAVIVITLLSIIFWFNPFIKDIGAQGTDGASMPLFLVMEYLLPHHPLILKIVGFVLFLSIAFLINRLNTKFIFIPERTYLPAIIYIIIICGLITKKELLPVLPATILLLIAIERLLDSYKTESLSYNTFDAGLLLGIGSLFYFPLSYYMIFIWSALLILRQFYWREWLFTLIGYFLSYAVLYGIYYLIGRDHGEIFRAIKTTLTYHPLPCFTKVQWAMGGYLVLLILIASRYLIKIYSGKKILPRKAYNLFLIIFLLSIAIFVFVPSVSIEILIVASVSVSLLISHVFITAKKSKWLIILFDFFILSLFAALYIKL
jgi:hypothetical protein